MDIDPLAYVTVMAPALGFDLPPDRAREVAEALAVVLRVAAPALALRVPPDTEPAPVFRA
jgi:hypothetical protein